MTHSSGKVNSMTRIGMRFGKKKKEEEGLAKEKRNRQAGENTQIDEIKSVWVIKSTHRQINHRFGCRLTIPSSKLRHSDPIK